MRQITSNFQAAVASKSITPILLFECYFDSGNLFLWTGYGALVYGGKTYTGAGTLLNMSQVKETNALEGQGVTLSLSGIPSSIAALALTEPYQNRTVKIFLGLLDQTGALVSDPRVLFFGKADVMSIIDGADSCVVTMTAENFYIDLTRARARRYTHEDQQIVSPGDMFLNFVETIQDKVFKWG